MRYFLYHLYRYLLTTLPLSPNLFFLSLNVRMEVSAETTSPSEPGVFKKALLLTFSLRAKQAFASQRINSVLAKWEKCDLISPLHRNKAGEELQRRKIEPYLSDFVSSLVLSLSTLAASAAVNGTLLATASITPFTALLIDRIAASAVRTAYTVSRIVQSRLMGNFKTPWLALGIGIIPVGGNAGYLVQQIAESGSLGSRILLADLVVKPLNFFGFKQTARQAAWWAVKVAYEN